MAEATAAPQVAVGWTDGSTIQALLTRAIVESLKDAAVSEEDMQQLLPALEEYTMNVAVRVSEVASSSSDGDDLLSTMILPEHVDDEVLSLRGQIDQANAEIAELRQQVPEAITASMAQQLAQLRPLLSMPAEGEPAPQQQPTELADVSVPGPEVDQQLAQLASNLPALRARVEEAVQRLGRILSAVEQDQTRSRSPKTVEKAMLNKLAPGRQQELEEDDEEDGAERDVAVRMKARLARDLLAAV